MILLKEKREQMKMSQQKLAEVSGVKQQTISKIESGISLNPGIETMHRLAVGLGCPLQEIYRPDGPGGVVTPKMMEEQHRTESMTGQEDGPC